MIPRNLGLAELRQAVQAGVRFRWATADEFYGRSSRWRREVGELGISYVVEVPKTTRGWIPECIVALDRDS
ncbi:MAG: transposase, partial [Planctomycetota bacterium]|nr:transposase [Planctomycetota bacterium]